MPKYVSKSFHLVGLESRRNKIHTAVKGEHLYLFLFVRPVFQFIMSVIIGTSFRRNRKSIKHCSSLKAFKLKVALTIVKVRKVQRPESISAARKRRKMAS